MLAWKSTEKVLKIIKQKWKSPKGAFTKHVYKIWLFLTPYPLRLHFLWYESLQKVDFFDHLPPSSCKHSLWTAPKHQLYKDEKKVLIMNLKDC